jgi:hypothetical protein
MSGLLAVLATIGVALTVAVLPAAALAVSSPSEVQTEPAEVTPTGFKLQGKLNPNGAPTTYYFIYKQASAVECEDLEGCGPETTPGGPLTGDTQQQVSPAEVTGLEPNTAYVYWLIAKNANGTAVGKRLGFTTPPAAPSIEAESVSNVTHNDATLEAQINPEGLETEYELWIECGVENFQCGSAERVGFGRLSAGDSGQAVSAVLSDLQSGDSYKYWVVATSSEGTTTSPVRTFRMAESWLGPVSETGVASNVTEREATLAGQIYPEGKGFGEFAYYFEYGVSTAYGGSAPAAPGGTIGPFTSCGIPCEGEKTSPKPVSVNLTGLEPGATYHYRLVSTNVEEGYRSFGEDATFTTVGGKTPLSETPPSETPPSSSGNETPSTTGGDGQAGTSSTQTGPGDSSVASGATPLVSPLVKPETVVKPKALTKAQKLAKALKQCKQEPKRDRAACERQAKKRYATTARDTGKKANEQSRTRLR